MLFHEAVPFSHGWCTLQFSDTPFDPWVPVIKHGLLESPSIVFSVRKLLGFGGGSSALPGGGSCSWPPAEDMN